VRAVKTYAAIVKAPEFSIGIECNADEITGIDYLEPCAEAGAENAAGARGRAPVARLAADPRFEFGLPLAPAGTHFQRRVWARISSIPAGKT
jgi:methylated-DNA-[protein]-cysteine S-methyltransferase